MAAEKFLEDLLQVRKVAGNLRSLKLPGNLVDFCSNDYLGIARDPEVIQEIARMVADLQLPAGSGGSRLLSGNYPLIREAEKQIAAFHDAPSGLIFNSGYEANSGLFSCVVRKSDTVVHDQLIHASVRDGIRLSGARSFSFRHQDLQDLDKKLLQATGEKFVAVESVYSMDGDLCPLGEVAEICDKNGARLIIDEAHATGVYGKQGEGLVQLEGLQSSCFARIHTFGKALGCQGAIVLGSTVLVDYLVNFCRPFIFTTALPPAAIAGVLTAYRKFPRADSSRKSVFALATRFRSSEVPFPLGDGTGPVQVVFLPGNDRAIQAGEWLRSRGLDVRPVLHPTVPLGSERLRIVLHSYNDPAEVDLLTGALREFPASLPGS